MNAAAEESDAEGERRLLSVYNARIKSKLEQYGKLMPEEVVIVTRPFNVA